ncbi:GPN-loop GTPase 2 [Cyphellophora attinorum]|uniref:GPN-loop GTPase 2 n=1 Tax=Cyphellophora attinorum TaxID=1664694 RepID=A0A0N1P0F6_9EURO|nr:GPN-loop GTPase 2 [Phialophora attinorum]KPI38940.1 GPN-loop GTPase 2 [Phialophora attinorum]
MPFAQLVVGPPGAGKSTYCYGMQQFMGAIGRKASIVNLDPANDLTVYEPAVDVRSLVTLEEIMKDDELGPNGGVLYALEEVEHNMEWLKEELGQLGEDYVLFDCPGQVELFTHHESLRKIFFGLQKMGYRLVVVNLIDSYALTLPSLYISTLLLSLRTMLQMDLTQINVLTKIDNLHKFPSLPFNLDFYTEVQDLSRIIPSLEKESPVFAAGKFQKLNEAVVELVEEFGLVSYEVLAVEDKKSMMSLLHTIDRAGGYAFGGAEGANDTVWQVAVREGLGAMDVRDIQERWIDNKEEWDEKERLEAEQEQKRREAQFGNGEMSDDLPSVPLDSGVKIRRSKP